MADVLFYRCVASEAEEVDVLYVDYSTTEFVPLTSILDVVPSHLEAFPRQAWKFTLTGMKPVSGKVILLGVKGHLIWLDMRSC